MVDAVEAVNGSFEDLIELYESSRDAAGKNFVSVDDKKEQLAALEALVQEQHRAQENPNQKLATIQAILDDQIETVETSEDKQKALEGVLSGNFHATHQGESRLFSDPEEKLNQIKDIVQRQDSHLHEKFSSIEAILGHSPSSTAPLTEIISRPNPDLTTIYENSKVASEQGPDPLDNEKKELLAALQTLVDEQNRLHENANQKLATVQAIVDNQIETVENPKDKQKALEGALAGDFLSEQQGESPSFNDPEEKLNQIESVVQDKAGLYSNPHIKFASIEAILGDHSKSSNPWVQAHNSLGLVEESSRHIIKAEEKRQKELKNLWRTGMDDKAKLYPEMAWDQKKWQYASMAMMAASFAGPWAAGASDQIARVIHPIVERVTSMEVSALSGLIEKGCNLTPELANNQGTQLVQVGSQTSSLQKKDRETLHDWETQQERQDLETQQQLVQEARQNDNSLKERHLEVIKTLTSMIVGR